MPPLDRRRLFTLIGGGIAAAAILVVIDQQTSAGSRTPAAGPDPTRPATATPETPDAGPATPEPAATGSGTTPAAQTPAGADATLIVYFSRAGENYPDLDLEIGNTAQLAGFIHDRVGGDLFELVPADPYPTSYDETTVRARTELDQGVFPGFTGDAPDTSRYTTVFLGYPNWWGEQPMIVQTFLRDHDLSHARVVPFTTHEGSGFGNSLSVLARYAPQAGVLEGFATRGRSVHENPDGTRGDVGAWLDQLGF